LGIVKISSVDKLWDEEYAPWSPWEAPMRKALLLCLVFLSAYFCPAQTAQSGLHGIALTLRLPMQTEATRARKGSLRADECPYEYSVLFQGASGPTCDQFLIYQPSDVMPAEYPPVNLKSGAIEDFYYADAAHWKLPADQNALQYLFNQSIALNHPIAVVAPPFYANDNAIGNLGTSTQPYSAVIGMSILSQSQQLDFRAGHYGRLHHNWITDSYSMLPDAENIICMRDENPLDKGVTPTITPNCNDLVFFSSLPGWNSTNGIGNWYTTDAEHIQVYNSSAGIKGGIAMDGFYTGAGDVELYNVEVKVKPATIGGSDEGVHTFRNVIAETPSYFGQVVHYSGGYDTTTPTGYNKLRVVPIGNPDIKGSTPHAQYMGMFQPMLDETDDVFNCDVSTPTGCSGAVYAGGGIPNLGNASVITDASASIPASIIGQVVSQSQLWTRPTQNQPVEYTVVLNTPTDLTTLHEPILLGMFLNPAGGLYEVVRVLKKNIVTNSDGTQSVTAFMRFAHENGAAFLAGGLTGRYIEFPAYTNTVNQRYVQNVFGSTSSILSATYSGGLSCKLTSGTLTFSDFSNASGAIATAKITNGDTRSIKLTIVNEGMEAKAGTGRAKVTSSDGASCEGTANITTTTGGSIIFGAMYAGGINSYPDTSKTPYSYKIYHGGDVEDERDPTPSQNGQETIPALVCHDSAPQTVDGCYVVLEDNDALWSKNAVVENTNHISATWHVDRQAPNVFNPFASVIGEEIDLLGPGGSAPVASADAIEMEAGTPPNLLSHLSGGLLGAPNGIVMGKINPFGSGLTMIKTPIGSTAPGFANGPDLLGVGAWWECPVETTYCTHGPKTDSTTYFQSQYWLFDQVPDTTSGGLGQKIMVNRIGTMEFQNYGTIFDAGGTGPDVILSSLAVDTGKSSSNLAGTLAFPKGSLPVGSCADTEAATCETHKFGYPSTFQPICTATAEFNAASSGAPWVTYAEDYSSMTVNFAGGLPKAGSVGYICIQRVAGVSTQAGGGGAK
jgi:hypothetical protein